MPAIQSIGLASNGALDEKTIDKLKAVDVKSQIDPINKRITKSKEQNTELSTLLVSIAGMKGAQNPLYDELEYLKVATDTLGDSVVPVVSAGVSPQNILISVKQLAKEDIIQSNSFATKEDTISNQDTSMSISMDGRTYEIDIKGTANPKEGVKPTKLSDLPSLILEATSGKITGSIIDTGGDTPYTLILKSRDVGKNNAILVGTIAKSARVINEFTLKDTVFQKSNVVINGVEIFGKISKTSHTGKVIDDVGNLPFQFNPGDFRINGTDIFDSTVKTNTISSGAVTINSTAANGDFKLNNIDVFTTSGFAETKSNTKLNDLKFPLSIGVGALSLNGTDIFDAIKPTEIITSVIKDASVEGTYKYNNLMINGVSIFRDLEDTVIDTLSSLVDAINLKTLDTNVSASITQDVAGNKKLNLVNELKGDNIDINTNDPLQLSKMRLSTGITVGNNSIIISDKTALLDTINEKSIASGVKALEIDGNLVLRSTKSNGRISLRATDQGFINELGFKEGIYNKSIPVSLPSLSEVVSLINKKTDEHNVVASIKENKLFLEHVKLGEELDISGSQAFLAKLKLSVDTIKPQKGKLVSSIQDVVDAINASTSTSNVQAVEENKKIVLKTTKVSTDIAISGKTTSLELIGLKESLISSINGEVLPDIQTVVDRINEKSLSTNVQAFLGSDNKITLLNTLGEDILFTGDEDKLNIVSFSIDSSVVLKNADSKKAVLEKLGISKSSQKLQNAQDSIFSYNGVDISRSTNNVDDIVTGIDFQLKKVDTLSRSTSISIKKDKATIINNFFEFITAYNSFIRKVSDLTKFTYNEKDPKASEAGAFQGKTTITNLPSQLAGILGNILPPKDLKLNSLIILGVDFTRDGTLSYKEDELRAKINSNFEEVEKLFRGYTKTSLTGVEKKIDGIFKTFNDKINDLTKGSKSVLETFKSSIEQETNRLNKTLKKTQETIDGRYEQLKQSFIANDAAIGKITNNFASLKKQIEYETASN